MSESEIARLQCQIGAEYEAAERGLHGLALGSTRHDFITRRMEQVEGCRKQLSVLVGDQRATELTVQAIDAAGTAQP
ncbi:MAG: hypothetical protein WCD86_06795 [Ktedonobacteraceae bacterium]